VLAAEAPAVMCGAQDLSPHDSGAYTGDVSGAMLTSVGCRYVRSLHQDPRALAGDGSSLRRTRLVFGGIGSDSGFQAAWGVR
jgi:triosephosphate isomerase